MVLKCKPTVKSVKSLRHVALPLLQNRNIFLFCAPIMNLVHYILYTVENAQVATSPFTNCN